MPKRTKLKPNLLEIINKIGENFKSILDEDKENEYFESIILNYSLIENLLKYTIYLKMTWYQTDLNPNHRDSHKERLIKFKKTIDYCNSINFYQAGEIALGINLIDHSLYQKISKIRKDRNNLLHQYWLLEHKNDSKKLKKILQEDIEASREIVGILMELYKVIGSKGVFDTSTFFK
jgi:hypothetical protein